MPDWKIDTRFAIPANHDVLAFLGQTMPSAHSDVAEELLRSATGLVGVSHYCPDPDRYAFVLLHLEDSSIIGLAYGQWQLAYRLAEDRIAEALGEGASRASELGRNWIFVDPWPSGEPLRESRRRLAQCCSLAAGFTSNPHAA